VEAIFQPYGGGGGPNFPMGADDFQPHPPSQKQHSYEHPPGELDGERQWRARRCNRRRADSELGEHSEGTDTPTASSTGMERRACMAEMRLGCTGHAWDAPGLAWPGMHRGCARRRLRRGRHLSSPAGLPPRQFAAQKKGVPPNSAGRMRSRGRRRPPSPQGALSDGV
jgi:hypothetical protein